VVRERRRVSLTKIWSGMTGVLAVHDAPTGLGQMDSIINAAVSTRFSTMLILLAVSESRIRGCLGVVVLLMLAVVLLLLGAAACDCHEGAAGIEQGVDEEGREKESKFWGWGGRGRLYKEEEEGELL
jgi:hypothetical protein